MVAVVTSSVGVVADETLRYPDWPQCVDERAPRLKPLTETAQMFQVGAPFRFSPEHLSKPSTVARKGAERHEVPSRAHISSTNREKWLCVLFCSLHENARFAIRSFHSTFS